MRRVNPRFDMVFLKLFGNEENSDLLLSFINAVLAEDDRIVEVKLRKTYSLADYRSTEFAILDIDAKDYRGNACNIGIQVASEMFFNNRALSYLSKPIGSEGDICKDLKKNISITILDFYLNLTEGYHNEYRMMNLKTKGSLTRHNPFQLHYLELLKFNKSHNEIVTPLDKWLAFILNAVKLKKDNLPEWMDTDPILMKAFMQLEGLFDSKEMEIYDIRLDNQRDLNSKFNSALLKGFSEGFDKGLKQSYAKNKISYPELEVEDYEVWRVARYKSFAEELISRGLCTSHISYITNLSQIEVTKIRNKLKHT